MTAPKLPAEDPIARSMFLLEERREQDVRVDPPRQVQEMPRRQSKRWSRTMKLVRRIHLYSGLFLVPWVLVYGISGYFFNHPTHWNDQATNISIPAGGDVRAALDEWPGAEALAMQVVARLREQFGNELQLEAGSAHYAGSFAWRGQVDGSTVSLAWSPGADEVRSRRRTRRRRQSAAEVGLPKSLPVDAELRDRVKGWGAPLQTLAGWQNTRLRLRSQPSLRFEVRDGDRTHTLRYDLARGGLTVRQGEGPSFRSFMQRLHLSRGYPSEASFRTVWAVIVDLMAGFMIIWGLSGLMMWWQMRKLRRIGLGVLALCAAVGVPLLLAMYRSQS